MKMSRVGLPSEGIHSPTKDSEVAAERSSVGGNLRKRRRSDAQEVTPELLDKKSESDAHVAIELMETPSNPLPIALTSPAIDGGGLAESEGAESQLLTILSSGGFAHIADLIVEYVAVGEGGAQAILNLRKVCSATKSWIDSLSPPQAKRIYLRIPVKFTPGLDDVKKFEETPPPPLACSLILPPLYWEPLYELDGEEVKTTFPAFFSFWKNQMTTLEVVFFGERLCEVLGYPQSLRNLQCRENVTVNPILPQLESLVFLPTSVSFDSSFLRDMVANEKLRRLFVIFLPGRDYRRKDYIKTFENLQYLINAKQKVKDFQVQISLGDSDTNSLNEDDLKAFLASLAASSSNIQIYSTNNKFVERILRLAPEIISTSKEMFRWTETLYLKSIGELTPELISQKMFPNLKTLDVDVSDAVQFDVICATVLPALPSSLTALKLSIRVEDDESPSWNGWDPEEWVEILSVINRRCPLLNELKIDSKISLDDLKEWKSSGSRSQLPPDSFKMLRSLSCDLRMEMNKNSGAGTFLFDILRIHEMRLLKLTLSLRYRYTTFWSDLETRIMESPLSETLVSLELVNQWNAVPAYVSRRLARLLPIVAENKRRREENYGKPRRRLWFL